MGNHRLDIWAKVRSIVMLLTLLFLALICGSRVGSSQQPESHAATSTASSEHTGGSSGSQAVSAQPAPNAPGWPFLRLVTVLFSGLVISAARLARQFRRFWGLGVFANPFAALFLVLGVGVCGVPVTTESALGSIPHLESLGPWIADLSGILVALILPVIRFRTQPQAATDSQVRDLEGVSSSNPILALIEDAIRDRILQRMQKEIVAASRRYDWDTIKLAASRALEEEMVIRPLRREDYDAVRQSMENFRPEPDSRVDSSNKYEALIRLLRWCSFQRLRRGLDAAAREVQS